MITSRLMGGVFIFWVKLVATVRLRLLLLVLLIKEYLISFWNSHVDMNCSQGPVAKLLLRTFSIVVE